MQRQTPPALTPLGSNARRDVPHLMFMTSSPHVYHLLSIKCPLQLSVEARRLLLISALLLPLRQLAVHAGKAHKPLPAASHIVRESIKWRVKEAEGVEILGAAAPQLLQVAEQLRASPSGEESEVPGRAGVCSRACVVDHLSHAM